MNGPAPVAPASISTETVDAARRLAFTEGRPLVIALESVCGLTPADFVEALGRLFNYRTLTMRDLQTCEAAFDWISYPECSQRNVLALKMSDGRGCLVLGDPFDAMSESWALRRMPSDTEIFVAHLNDIVAYLAQQEERLRAMQDIVGELDLDRREDAVQEISLARIGDDDSAVIRLVNSTIYDALKMQASDIHLECDAGTLIIKYRIDGVLVHISQVNGAEMAEQVISRIKVMAELDIAERRIPQDGRFKVRISGREIDFRVSIMPSIFSEDAVLRLLDRRALTEQAQSLRLDNLGFDASSMRMIRTLASKPHGMLLVTGPTGSGKTTTLYAAISEIHTGRDKIVTIEDPVEYRLPRVLQIPVNEKKGLTFARGLRSILRHDPDKIMVGEIRDDETAQIAVQAALTGHLVFTTVHANSAFDVLGRFLHMGVDPYSLASALNGIVAQRLLRLNCPHCVQACDIEDADLQGLRQAGIDELGITPRAGSGCGHCRGTGYKGRRAAAEILTVNDTVREMIASKAPVSQLRDEAAKGGLRPLRTMALEWAARGETTFAEVARVAG